MLPFLLLPYVDDMIRASMSPLEKEIYAMPKEELLRVHTLVIEKKSGLSRRQREVVIHRVKNLKKDSDE